MFAKLNAQYNERAMRGLRQPGTVFLTTDAYKHFNSAMQIVNRRIGVPAPADGLYVFKGIKLRCIGG